MQNITQQALLASSNSHSHSEIFYFCLHFKYKSAEGQGLEAVDPGSRGRQVSSGDGAQGPEGQRP